jgi:hypothetical protein
MKAKMANMKIFRNRESKWGDNFRDLGMEGIRRGRESGRKIFERDARSGQIT